MKKYLLFVVYFVAFLLLAEFVYYLGISFFQSPTESGTLPAGGSIAEGFAAFLPILAAAGAYLITWKGRFRKGNK